jgi:tRNA(Ile)-lysidine synthase
VPERYVVGFSGGVDSALLLTLLAEQRGELAAPLEAIHVDHRLQADSGSWAVHCEQFARRLGVPLRLVRADAAPAPGESPEAAARRVRYRAFSDLLPGRDMLLLAHHMDDQAETLLLQLLRGAGVDGLASMPVVRDWGSGWIGRPLLSYTRQQIETLARERGIAWIEDPSNADTRADRNFLRQQVMPLLRQRWPSASGSIARSASLCGVAADFIRQEVNGFLVQARRAGDNTLDLDVLHRLEDRQTDHVLRAWLKASGIEAPSMRRLQELRRQVLAARPDASVCVVIGDWAIRRFAYRLWLTPAELPVPPDEPIAWQGRSVELGKGLGRLSRARAPAGVSREAWRNGKVTVSFRQSGVRLQPAGRQGSRSFKQIAQECAIPPWMRPLTPIVLIDDVPAAVVGCCICEGFASPPGRSGIELTWSGSPLHGLAGQHSS